MALIGEFGAVVREIEQSEPDEFVFFGETFTVADRVGAMPLLRFAAVAEAGTQAEELAGMAAMHELLRDCLAPGDWPRFQKVAADNKADAEELMAVCGAIYQAVTGRPTQRPSDSAGGSSPTTESSREPSSSEESLSPIMRDERVRALRPVSEAGRDIAQTG
jgi:hypothetical protein